MKFKDVVVGAAIIGSSFLGDGAQAQTADSSARTEQKATQDKVMLGDFDITDYADVMKKRGFEVQLDKSGVGVYQGTDVPMLQIISTRKVDGRDITVTDYLVHRGGRDFDKTSDGMAFDMGDLEQRDLSVKGAQQQLEYTLNVDYDTKNKNYRALSNVIGTGTRELPSVSGSDATLLLSRIAADPAGFVEAERKDMIISRRDVDGGGRTAPKTPGS